MALKVIWSPQAVKSFSDIIDYLQENWTDKEIANFIRKSSNVIEYISDNPNMFKVSEKQNYLHKALIIKPVSLIYRYKPRKQEIELVTFWNNRRKPVLH